MGQVESGSPAQRRAPAASVARLPQYLRVLSALAGRGITRVTSSELGERLGLTSANVRKDLSALGIRGVRGAPYDVGQLSADLRRSLRVEPAAAVLVVGSGEMAESVLQDRALTSGDYRVIAVADPVGAEVTGSSAGQTPRLAFTDLHQMLPNLALVVAIVATAGALAQRTVDVLSALGVRRILNLTATDVSAPSTVLLSQRDLAGELAELVYSALRQSAGVAVESSTIDLRERRRDGLAADAADTVDEHDRSADLPVGQVTPGVDRTAPGGALR